MVAVALMGLVVTLLSAILAVNMGVFLRVGRLTEKVEVHAERIEKLENRHG